MADYTSLAEVRAIEGFDDVALYPDAVLVEGIEFAEELIDRYTGTSWTYKTFTVTLTGNNSAAIVLRDDEGRTILYPRSLSSVTIDGVAQTTTAWALYPEGKIVRDTGVFTFTNPGRNIVVSGTAGFTAEAPYDIAWCARTIARQYVIDLTGRIPDRALQIQSEFGTIQMAQASAAPDRPTSLPDVNAKLVRRRQVAPAMF